MSGSGLCYPAEGTEMRRPKYLVDLSEEEQAELEALVRKGKSSARKQTRAHSVESQRRHRSAGYL